MTSIHDTQDHSFFHPSSSSSPFTPHILTTKKSSASLKDPPKKRKAARACINCQRAHLTCDEGRPCQRCIKKGISDSCTEGHRKKAKYLLDEDELEALKNTKPGRTEDSATPSLTSSEMTRNTEIDPSLLFGSHSANLEYSMLSAMLGDDRKSYVSNSGYNPPDFGNSLTPTSSRPYLPGTQNEAWPPNQPVTPALPLFTDHGNLPSYTNEPQNSNMFTLDPMAPVQQFNPMTTPPNPLLNPATSFLRTNSQSTIHALPPEPPYSALPPISPTHQLSGTPDAQVIRRVADVYASVMKPYDYTQGYHFLMSYLQENFDKNDILRVVRALAIFRPSLIALQMPLTEEDEIFVEKCFQRSLLELEKLITYSGTPTVVWRRTGEICLAGLEFSMLTEWSQHDLLGQRRYIYELFERQSVIEYWEKFASHAFENATQSVNSVCVLLKPSGEPVPCAFSFSIRRDLFDLPSFVIGHWLPLFA